MIAVALVIVVGVLLAIRKGYDVRLVLITAGIILTVLAGKPLEVIDVIGKTLSNTDVTGPICSAMGYAFVLRKLGADKALVALLAHPLRRRRLLLIPGGCFIGFITNIAIPSQTATAAAVGPIIIPLMLAAGYNRLAAAATLLVGCSVGGSLLNPGDADVVSVRIATKVPQDVVMSAVTAPNILALMIAVVVLIILVERMNHDQDVSTPRNHEGEAESFSMRRVLLALLAPLPVVVLLVTQPRYELVPSLIQAYPEGLPVYSVMFASTFLAMLISYTQDLPLAEHVTMLTSEFFDGMGYGLAKIISIIIAAGCFLAGLKAVGLIESISALLLGDSTIAIIVSPIATCLMAMMSGSGTAPAVSFSQAVLPTFVASGAVSLAIMLGVLASIGANIGRTMSPVSAVMYFVSDLAAVEPRELIKVVSLPLISALAAIILYGLVSS